MPTGFLWFIIFFLPYGLLHSWMASTSWKKRLADRWPAAYHRWYRLIYNFVSFVTLLPLVGLFAILPDAVLFNIASPWSYLLRSLQFAALVFAAVSILQTDIWSFLGIRQLLKPESGSDNGFPVTTGFYHLVRHPVYLFSLLFIWLSPSITWNILGFNIGATLYLIIGMVYEERKLLREFGVEYQRYQKQVPILIPFIKLNR